MDKSILPAILLSAGVLVSGCAKEPIEAPGEIEDLSLYLFANFDSETGDELTAGIPELKSFLKGLELDDNLNDRFFEMPTLEGADLGGIDGPNGADPAAQLPVAVAGISKNNFKANRELVGEKNHVCIESNSTVYYDRTFDTEKACFVDGECDRVDTSNEVRKETAITKIWYDMYKDYRVVESDDGIEAMYARGWTEEVFPGDGGTNSFDQLYTMEAWIADGKNTLRFYVMWSAVTINAIGDDFYLSLVKSGINEGYQNADAFMDGDSDCGNDRDREYDRYEE